MSTEKKVKQNILKSYTNRNTITYKSQRPLYIKNPFSENLNSLSPDVHISNNFKFTNFLANSYASLKK